MTKYKEFMRAHGIKLECDFDCLPCNDLQSIETKVMDDCVVAFAYYNNANPRYVAYDSFGEHGWFEAWGEVPYEAIERFNYSLEYIDWLHGMCRGLPDAVFKILKRMYLDDAKVRIGYKHMRAGIMDEFVFAKWLAKCYQKVVESELIVEERY